MRVFINDREVGPLAAGGATVGEIVEALRVHVDPREIVTGVELDGVCHSAGERERFAHRAAEGVERLALTVETPETFAASRRHDLAGCLGTLARKVGLVVDLLRRSDARAANALLAALMEELRLALLLDRQLAVLVGTAPAGPAGEIQVLGESLLGAEERRAWEEVAELLSSRLVPLLEAWSRAESAATGGEAAAGEGRAAGGGAAGGAVAASRRLSASTPGF
jgi:hypothetical protein